MVSITLQGAQVSSTYRIVYQFHGTPYTRVVYVTTTDPQLAHILEHLEGVRIDPGEPMSQAHPLTDTESANQTKTAERKAGQR